MLYTLFFDQCKIILFVLNLGLSWDQSSALDHVPVDVIPELYEKYKDAVNDVTSPETTRRLYTNDKVYEVHVKKLKEVNGLKKHNLLIKEDSAKNPLIYINNPVETRVPNPYLSLTEFQQLLMTRAAANKAPTTKAKLPSVNYGPNKRKPTRTVWSTKPNSLKRKTGNPRAAKEGKPYMRSNLKTNRDKSKSHGINPTENNSNKGRSFSGFTSKPNAKISKTTAIDSKTIILSVSTVTDNKNGENTAFVSEKSEKGENLAPIIKSDAVIDENGDKNENGDKSAATATQNSGNGITSTDTVETDEATPESTIADSTTTTTTTRRTLGRPAVWRGD